MPSVQVDDVGCVRQVVWGSSVSPAGVYHYVELRTGLCAVSRSGPDVAARTPVRDGVVFGAAMTVGMARFVRRLVVSVVVVAFVLPAAVEHARSTGLVDRARERVVEWVTVETVPDTFAAAHDHDIHGRHGHDGHAPSTTVPSVGGSPPATQPAGDQAFAFMAVRDGVPVVWPACTPVRFAVSDSFVAAGLEPALWAAVAEIEAVSPYRFEQTGTLPVDASSSWRTSWEHHGVPVLLSVVARDHSDMLGPRSAANGGGYGRRVDGHYQMVSGSVVVAAESVGRYVGVDGPTSMRVLLLHELLHVIGLDHVDDPTSVMNGHLRDGADRLGPGDIAGLAAAADTHPC